MQTTAIRTVAKSLPQNKVILLTCLISNSYIPYTDLRKELGLTRKQGKKCTSGEILSKNANRKKGNVNRNPSTFQMFSPLYFCSVGHIGKSFLCYPSFLNKPSIYK